MWTEDRICFESELSTSYMYHHDDSGSGLHVKNTRWSQQKWFSLTDRIADMSIAFAILMTIYSPLFLSYWTVNGETSKPMYLLSVVCGALLYCFIISFVANGVISSSALKILSLIVCISLSTKPSDECKGFVLFLLSCMNHVVLLYVIRTISGPVLMESDSILCVSLRAYFHNF